jgi:hypothetical protein
MWLNPVSDAGAWEAPPKHGLQPPQNTLWRQENRLEEHSYFVDQLVEFIPYWIKGVEAAERGEDSWKLEEFLESRPSRQPRKKVSSQEWSNHGWESGKQEPPDMDPWTMKGQPKESWLHNAKPDPVTSPNPRRQRKKQEILNVRFGRKAG